MLQCVAVRIRVVIHKGQNVTEFVVQQDRGAGFLELLPDVWIRGG